MRRRKRTAALLLALALALALPAGALGQEEIPAVKPGDTFDASFSVTENPSAAVAASLVLSYDHDALELIPSNWVQQDSTFAQDLQGIPVGYAISAQFQVLPGAQGGVYRIEMNVAQAGDINENWVEDMAFSSFEVRVDTSDQAQADTSPAEDFEYALRDGKAVIVKYLGSAETVVIPDTLEGCPVTAIEARAFYHFSGIRSVVIPSGVLSIGERAFYHCSGLQEISLPNTLTSIGDSAFRGCFSLAEVSIPGSVYIIAKNTFQSCTALEAVTLGEGVTWVESDAFKGCSQLARAELPGSLNFIASSAFQDSQEMTATVTAYSYAEKYCQENGIAYVRK